MQFAIKCPCEPPVRPSGRVETNVVSLSTVVETPQKLLPGINVIQTCLTLATITSVLLSPVLSTMLADTIQSFGNQCWNQVIFRWGNQEQKEFDTLKRALCSDEVLLRHPNWNNDFIVQTDASSKGLGAVLSQIGPDNKEHPVRYASRALQLPESKWTTREQELLAIIWACETFHRYHWGRKFFIQSPNRPCKSTMASSRKPTKKSLGSLGNAPSRVRLKFELQHRSGKNNGNADAL